MRIKYKYVGNFDAPRKQTADAAGVDLFNNTNNNIEIKPGESKIVDTGFFIEIPKNYVGLLAPRSSLGFKFDCTLSNSVGIIDSDYRGEVKAKIINLSKNTHIIEPGERVAQLVIVPIAQYELEKVEALSETDRGEKGFGSTGRRGV